MFKLIKNFSKREWFLVLLCFVFVLLQVWLELKMPDYMSEITKINRIILTGPKNKYSNLEYIGDKL